MRKVLSVFIAVCLVLSLFTGVFAPVPSVMALIDGDYTYTVANNTATITGYTGSGGAVAIPNTLGTGLVLSSSWNLVSVSVPLSASSIPGLQAVYGYHDNWSVPTTLTPGQGYWVQVENAVTIPLAGTPSTAPVPITYQAGWQLLGNPFDVPVPITSITNHGLIATCYSYDPLLGWGILNPVTDSLQPGKGYWINLSAPATLTLGAAVLPDLTVDTLYFLPVQPTPGGSVTLYFTIHNQGAAPVTADYVMSLYGDGVLWGTGTNDDRLTSGASQGWHWPITWPSDTASHTFMVVLDPGNVITESNESNNSASISTSASGTAPSITVTSPTDGTVWSVGETRSITWTVSGSPSGIAYFLLRYNVDGGSNYDPLDNVSTAPSTATSYNWIIPNAPSSQCSIVVIAMDSYDNPMFGGFSSGLFTISTTPSIMYTLTTTASPSAGGTIGRSPNAASYASGTVVTLTANANPGYHFVNWSGDLTGATNPTTITMSTNRSVTAVFQPDTLAAPVLISPANDAVLSTLTPTLSWSVVPGATKYEVRVWVGSATPPPYVIDEVLAATSYTVPAGVLSSGVRYGWTVFAGNSAGWGPQLTIPGDTLSPAFTVQVVATGAIRIQADDQFTGTNGVVSGSGTQADPYIIEGWTIDASIDTSVLPYMKVGIDIDDTSRYFVIRDCHVENAGEYGAGISLGSMSNGRVENCVVRNCGSGISLGGDSNVVLSGNTIENCRVGISDDNSSCGHSSDGVTISNNTVTGCTDTGIFLQYVKNSSASGNTVTNNSDGIELSEASGCTISNNIVQGNTGTGIGEYTPAHFENSIDNIISYNDTSGNGDEGIYVTCSHNTISHNTSNGNGGTGIRLDYVTGGSTADYNTVSNNTANNNGGDGIDVSGDYNTISNNTANNNVMNGIDVGGDYNTISNNTALSNNALGYVTFDGQPSYYDILIWPNTNILEGNVYGTIKVVWP